MDASQLLACGISHDAAEAWSGPLTAAAQVFGIEDGLQTAHWIGQMMVECNRFTVFEENLNYSADSLVRMWPNRVSRLVANRIGRIDGRQRADQRAIANLVYANRFGNGPPESGDGWKFAGKGPKQLTFHDNYLACGDAIGYDLVGDPRKILDPEFGALSAAWFWSSRNLGPLADADDVLAITHKINGGENGLKERIAFTATAKEVFA
jgi:putative chitinase